MITVEKGTKLTYKNLLSWIKEWEKDKARLVHMRELYRNRKSDSSKPLVKLPFAKKLTVTSASATVGEGVSIAAPNLEGAQKDCFEKIKSLFRSQTIIAQDRSVIKQGCIYGRGYELVYFSSDETPIPKVSCVSAENAFVVFDNTVEHNSLYGVRFERYTKEGKKWLAVSVYDETYEYNDNILESSEFALSETMLEAKKEHKLGRVPLTEYHNNPEEQGDFEQVVDLIYDRTTIHNDNLKDFKAIAKNYLKSRNVELVGNTDEEKNKSQDKLAANQRIEIKTDPGAMDGANDDINILSKNENYVSITDFGGDIDSKIYDLAMIPNLSDEQFAGNQTGVALELKLLPFKEMILDKDEEIEKLYKRRIKMYMQALIEINSSQYSAFDISEVNIQTNRNWSKNLLEIAQIITALVATGKFSDKTIINMVPKIDYDEEKEQIQKEAEDKAKNAPDPNNQSVEWLASLLAGRSQEEPEGNVRTSS